MILLKKQNCHLEDNFGGNWTPEKIRSASINADFSIFFRPVNYDIPSSFGRDRTRFTSKTATTEHTLSTKIIIVSQQKAAWRCNLFRN